MRHAYPRYEWPTGKTSAFWLSVDVDAESPLLWEMRGKPITSLGQLEARRFGIRRGLYYLLELLERRGIKASFYVPGVVAELHPEVLPLLHGAGHEIGVHGYNHERVETLGLAENRCILERCLNVFQEQVGIRPLGHRAPAWELSPEYLDLLREFGFAYDSSLMGFDHPYSVNGLCQLPVQWTLDDALYFKFLGDGRDRWHPADPGAVLHAWLEESEGVRAQGGLCSLTIHPWISGRGQGIRLLDRLLNQIQSHVDVWLPTGQELAQHHQASVNAQRFDVPGLLADTAF